MSFSIQKTSADLQSFCGIARTAIVLPSCVLSELVEPTFVRPQPRAGFEAPSLSRKEPQPNQRPRPKTHFGMQKPTPLIGLQEAPAGGASRGAAGFESF
jgi:hypothetical protein